MDLGPGPRDEQGDSQNLATTTARLARRNSVRFSGNTGQSRDRERLFYPEAVGLVGDGELPQLTLGASNPLPIAGLGRTKRRVMTWRMRM